MALRPEQQAVELISRAKNILITTREHASTDSLSSAVAMGLVLKKLNKTFDICVPGYDAAAHPAFLPKLDIRHKPGAMRAFHISLDVRETPLSELLYDVKDGKLEITLVPKQGDWMPKDVAFKHGDDRYDLIIALDSPDMASLGDIAKNQADFVYRTTIINIDHSAANEAWGQVNLVDLNAVSTSEVLFTFLQGWNKSFIDEALATSLLAGMISKTKGFRTQNVTPKTLKTSSELVTLGAKRGDIVSALWRTQSIANLKLWGRVLSRLEQDRELGLVWSILGESDFLEAGAKADALEGVVDELISYAPEAKTVLLAVKKTDGLHVHVFAQAPRSAAELARVFEGSGNRERALFISRENASPNETMKKILERMRGSLAV
ncbi:hypothetical protein IT407_00730 [Candidatus Uhrbacteria bacterium]|nr:hypothetical protein [Candidatus Uhrbacteria bacterium]